MSQPDNATVFNEERAASYDDKSASIAAMKDSLHLSMRMVLGNLPDEACILCVGSGTGAEILYLAEAFPNWTFTGVDPAPAMVSVCREKIEAAGISDRCTVHEGYLDTLPPCEPFDAATSILVSQFVLDDTARRSFFQTIGKHLKPDGLLIDADLSTPLRDDRFETFLDIWMRLLAHGGMEVERAVYGRDVALTPPDELARLIESAGFERPVQFNQTLLIHAWYARRTR